MTIALNTAITLSARSSTRGRATSDILRVAVVGWRHHTPIPPTGVGRP